MPSRLRFGDIELDCAAFELRRGGLLQPVEPQVFELLSYLAGNPARLITKDELIESIWNGRIVSDATLASRIKSARRAIGDDGEQQKWIRTVHGRGVRFMGAVKAEPTYGAAESGADASGRPAIAVLPFANLGDDPDRSLFADGVVEEITAALSRMPSLIVIARSSTQRYRDQPIDPARIRQELGVRYLVEGSVRRWNGTVRIGARLIQAASGVQVWADHYDGRIERLFELEDRIALDIVAAVAPAIRGAEIERARRKQPENLVAYDCVMRALPQLWSLSQDGIDEALRLTAQAIRLEPGYALAYALGAWCQFWRFVNDWGPSREETRAEGARLAREALRLDGGDPDVLTMVSAVEMVLNRDVEAASMQIEKALALNPNSAWAWIRSAYMHVYRGDAAPALQHFARAERLSPFDPMNFNRYLGTALAHFIDRRYELAVEWAAKALRERPLLFWGYLVQAASHGLLGNRDQASLAAAKVRAINPAITIAGIIAVKPFAPDDFGARFAEGLRRAGLPEGGAVEAPDLPQATAGRTTQRRPSVAVLPFAAIGADAEGGNLADGLTEDIITDLSKVSGLFVVARNSVFAYQGRGLRVERIAEELGISHVLEGTVRCTGQGVRVTAQLIDGRSGGHLWAERYDRSLTDILALQEEIARNVVAALRVRLLPEESAAIALRPTANPEAYQYYLLGRSFFLRTGWGHRAMHVARRMFVKAASIDPGYARAYAAIANCDSYLLCMGDPEAAFGDILANCARALELEPDLADAHAAMGLALFTAGRSEEARLSFERAMKLAPDSFEAHFFAGRCARAQGDLARAAALFERAAALQPDDFRALGLAAHAYRALGREDPALDAARRCLERIEGELAIHADDAKALAFGASILVDLGERGRAREWTTRAEALDPADLITNYNLACAWIALGETEAGLARLERMFAVPATTRRLHLAWIRHDISLDPVREHPRYLELVRHLEADEPVARAGT